MADPVPTLRERTKDAVRDQIRREAIAIFLERGFDATRIDDIAAAAGISTRSFFRYFLTKEDVLVGGSVAFGDKVRDALAARPASEGMWVALRRALDPAIDVIASAPENLQLMSVIMGAASLRASHFEKHLAWEEMLVSVLTERHGDGLRTRVLTHAALACFDSALFEWVRRDGSTSLPELLDQAFAVRAEPDRD